MDLNNSWGGQQIVRLRGPDSRTEITVTSSAPTNIIFQQFPACQCQGGYCDCGATGPMLNMNVHPPDPTPRFHHPPVNQHQDQMFSQYTPQYLTGPPLQVPLDHHHQQFLSKPSSQGPPPPVHPPQFLNRPPPPVLLPQPSWSGINSAQNRGIPNPIVNKHKEEVDRVLEQTYNPNHALPMLPNVRYMSNDTVIQPNLNTATRESSCLQNKTSSIDSSIKSKAGSELCRERNLRRSRSTSREKFLRKDISSSRSLSYKKSRSARSRSPSPHRHSRRSPPRSYSPRKSRSPSRRSSRRSPSKNSSIRSRSPSFSRKRKRSPISPQKHTTRNSPSLTVRNIPTINEKQAKEEKELDKEKHMWTRTAPADLYYKQAVSNGALVVNATDELLHLCDEFQAKLIKKSELIRANLPKYEPFPRKKKIPLKKHSRCHSCSGSSSSDDSSNSDMSDHEDFIKEEIEYKRKHPLRLHEELWFNHPGEMNDGPLCRCSAKARRSGIRHNIYAGENHLISCRPDSNNADKLYHYRITMSPPTNFLVKRPTIIEHDAHEYIFEGFSMFSHKKLGDLPLCKVIRFNIEYTIVYYEEKFPQNFTVRELDIFYKYLFHELLELVDLDFRAHGDTEGCPQYHFMPRFVRELPENGKEILSMNEVLKYLLKSYQPLVDTSELKNLLTIPQPEWQDFTDYIKGMIVTYPGKKPCSLRIDQLDRDLESTQDQEASEKANPTTEIVEPEQQYPQIVHFGIRPPELSYAGNPEYQKAWREYVKFRHLLANMPKPSSEDKRKLKSKEMRLQVLRTKNELKRNVTVTVSSEHFYKSGIMCDMVQHAMLLPVLVSHLRFHRSLDVLEDKLRYTFTNRYLLQLALTHPSYRENFGTNPDHARNSLTNCGIRQPVYGDRRIHYMNTRKRGINTLINIMSKFGKSKETESNITHNERLEFLGDAVVEFVTSVHLFHMFPELEEGGLATYRSAIVQNQHLAVLAKKLGLEEFMLYAHGSDLCHDLELRHAMANCFEALMGALFLDGGINVADRVFGEALFQKEPELLSMWVNYPPHPLQEQEPLGDRKWIEKFSILQKLTKFEKSIGVEFTHIRLLARAFTDRSIGYTNLTLGSNQRLEFLGDTVLQLIASEYLYKYFPEHHEGHLSLLRSSLVNNRTQSVVCDDLGMTTFALYSNPKAELKTKDRADLLEAFLGALYVDKGIECCEVFCGVCFFPRLQTFILHQDWNDPKSKLQQCCLTLRTMEGGEPEIPVYKVIESKGPTNTRIYTVAVYFKGKRLAEAAGHSIQQAEMNAAKKALRLSQGLFPQLDHQKRVISKSMNHQIPSSKNKNNSTKQKEKQGKTEGVNKDSSKDKNFDPKRRSKTPPLAYRSRNSPETTKTLSKKKAEKEKNKEDKRKCCKSTCESGIHLKQTCSIECSVNEDEKLSCDKTKAEESCSESDSDGNKIKDVSPPRSSSNSLEQELVEDVSNNSESVCKLRVVSNSVLFGVDHPSRKSDSDNAEHLNKDSEPRILSSERNKPDNLKIGIHHDHPSQESSNMSFSKRSKSRSPVKQRSQRTKSRSPVRQERLRSRSRSSSRYRSNRNRSKSPYRQSRYRSKSRSPKRETSHYSRSSKKYISRRNISRSPVGRSIHTRKHRSPFERNKFHRSRSRSPRKSTSRRSRSREKAKQDFMDLVFGSGSSSGSHSETSYQQEKIQKSQPNINHEFNCDTSRSYYNRMNSDRNLTMPQHNLPPPRIDTVHPPNTFRTHLPPNINAFPAANLNIPPPTNFSHHVRNPINFHAPPPIMHQGSRPTNLSMPIPTNCHLPPPPLRQPLLPNVGLNQGYHNNSPQQPPYSNKFF
nr:drosha [Amrasca biguttula biguttula]